MEESQPEQGSVTREIAGLKNNDPQAIRELWEKCFGKLKEFANKKLGGNPHQNEDSEDVALEVFDCLCRGVAKGRWPQLENREDLWRVLFTLTRHKAIDLIRKENAEKRGSRGLQSWSGEFADNEFGPDEIVILNDQLKHLLGKLPDDSYRNIACLKMELHTVPEMAEKLGYSPRTIERKLNFIRKVWENEFVDF